MVREGNPVVSDPRSEEDLMASEAVSEDALLDGRLKLRQPKHGYRVAIDPVFLAAAVPAEAGEKVLDVGAGSGAAALCLARRVPGCHVAGIEIGRDMVRLAAENIALNGLGGRVEVVLGDSARPPPGLGPGSFAHVRANPPHLEAGRATPSPAPGRARARVEGGADLGAWVRFCLAMVRPRGSVTFIHRADRLDALLAGLHGRAGGIVVFPLWPGGHGGPAKRVLVRGCKDVQAPTRLVPGLVLHRADGAYTQAAEAVLRHGAALEL